MFVQRALGLRDIPCIDIRQQCSGFIYGLSIADVYIRTGAFKHILLIGSEQRSWSVEPSPHRAVASSSRRLIEPSPHRAVASSSRKRQSTAMHKNVPISIDRVTGDRETRVENIHLIQRCERQIAICARHAGRETEIEDSLISAWDIAAR